MTYLAALLFSLVAPAGPQAEIPWLSDLSLANARALESGRPLMLVFR